MGSLGLGFKEWALKEAAYWHDELSDLNGIRIGIDAEEYLTSFLVSKKEPLLPALGGLPFSLKSRVDEDLQHFQDAGIEPVFVFNGMDQACNDRASILKSSVKASDTLDGAWKIYDAGRADDAVAAFGMACTYRTSHIVRGMRAHLHSMGVFTMVAPYAAAAQLVQLEANGMVKAIFGSASCLIHKADSIIINFDWDNGKFQHTDMEKCAEELGVSQDQLIDLCLLCGYSVLPVMPELEHEANVTKPVTAKVMLQRANGDAYTMASRSKDEGFQMLFHKARFAVKHATAFQPKTLEVNQINPDLVPPDTHDFVSQRLPNELYWYLVRGLASPRVLNWRTRMEVLELPPLDSGMSQTYKELVNNKLVPLRTQSLVLITHLLHRYYQKRDVDLGCWFTEGDKKTLNIPDNLQSAKQADYWHVTAGDLPSSTSAPLRYAISALADEAFAKKTVKHHEPNTAFVLTKKAELRPNVVWRFLEDRGYVKADHTLSAWGKVLNTALQAAADNGSLSNPKTTREIEEAIFVALELIRFDTLSTRNMFPMNPYSGQPMRGFESDKQNVLLYSRVGCLLTIQHKAIGYTGPLSRHLLAYHQVTAAVRGALRDLVEMHACNLFLGGSVKRKIGPPEMFTDLSFDLPFVNEPDAGLGLLVKSYLDELSHDNIRKKAKESVSEWFVHAEDIEGDLQKVWKVFEAINAGLQSADNSTVNAETKKMFKNAIEWLRLKEEAQNTPTTEGMP